MNKIFKSPREVFEDQLNDIFSSSSEENVNVILKALSLLLRMPSMNNDLVDLYNLVGLEQFVGVISLFENRTVKFPNRNEVKDLILTSLLYYYHEVENLSWSEIREKIPFEFSSISYSIKIKKFNSFITNKLYNLFVEDINE